MDSRQQRVNWEVHNAYSHQPDSPEWLGGIIASIEIPYYTLKGTVRVLLAKVNFNFHLGKKNKEVGVQNMQREAVTAEGECMHHNAKVLAVSSQTYGKGSARECGKHVKKLNMVRGERERAASDGVRGSHPPHDYANTFTTGRKEAMDQVRSSVALLNPITFDLPPCSLQMEHPVVLADRKKSKWTTFLEPSKDEVEMTPLELHVSNKITIG